MMLRLYELLLTEQTLLYNNSVNAGDCDGRLWVNYRFSPQPRIEWEFESLGLNSCLPEVDPLTRHVSSSLVGTYFALESAYEFGQSWTEDAPHGYKRSSGIAFEAYFGDASKNTRSFDFLLPNTKFFYNAQFSTEKVWAADGNLQGFVSDIKIDDAWDLRLQIGKDSLKWLTPWSGTTGTLATCLGVLRMRETSSVKGVSVYTATEVLKSLCALLSFANGGFVGPLAVSTSFNPSEPSSTQVALAPVVTPIELIGETWLIDKSDLPQFVSCFSTFEQMMATKVWKDSFPNVLQWYFQAIQPQDLQIRIKPWPIVANALGAALERLHWAIVVQEMRKSPGGRLAEKLKILLEAIGIDGSIDKDFMEDFAKIRNDATHPERRRSVSDDDRWFFIDRATQVLEEVLLWRLGYKGCYRNRGIQSPLQTYRYDLSLRSGLGS